MATHQPLLASHGAAIDDSLGEGASASKRGQDPSLPRSQVQQRADLPICEPSFR